MWNTIVWKRMVATSCLLCTIYLCLFCSWANAQGLRQNFDTGTVVPSSVWQGTDTAWIISEGRLQSHWQQVKSSFYLSTQHPLQADSWEWWMKLGFNPSSQNYVDIFLLADTLNLLSSAVSGYFVRVGNTADEVSLYHLSAGQPAVKLIDGTDGVLNHASNTLKVRVMRHGGHWEMQIALGNTANYDTVHTAVDSSAGAGGYFGLAIKQSTASFFEKHYFDDFVVGEWKDTTALPPDTVITPPDTVVTPPITPPDTTVNTPPDTVVTPPVTPPDTTVITPPDTVDTPPVTPPDTTVITPPDTVVIPPITPPDTTVITPPDTVITPPVTPPDTTVITPPDTVDTPPVTPPDTTVITPPDTVITPPVTPPDTTVITPPDTVVTPPVTPPDTTVITPPDTVVTPPVTPPDTTVITPPDTVVTPPITPPDTVDTPPVTPPDTTVITPPDTVVTPPITPPDTTVITPQDTVVTPPVTPPDTTVITPPDTVVTPPITPPDTTVITPPDTVVAPPVTPPDTTVITPPDTVVTPPVTPPDTTVITPPDTVVTPPVTPPDTTVITPPDTVVTPPITPPDTTVTPLPTHIVGRAPVLYNLIINEILPDPTPVVQLPGYRFVELRNRSQDTLQLQGCTIGNRIRQSVLPQYALAPDSLLIVCDVAAVSSYLKFGATVGVRSFPAFKTADTILLRNATGVLLHVVAYNKNTYKNEDFSKGGHSLEIISDATPCSGGENWSASTAPSGGSPGKRNTVDGEIQPMLPDLLQVFPLDSLHLQLTFSATLDSAMAMDLQHYQFKNNALQALQADVVGPLWDEVHLVLKNPLQQGILYTLSTRGIVDCNGLESGLKNEASFACTGIPDSLDIIFNEVMYDPLPGVPQFIEIYNRSKQAVDLSHLYWVMQDKYGADKNVLPLSGKPALLLSGAYAVISNDPGVLCQQAVCGLESPLLTVHLPQLSNDGAAMLLRYDGHGLDAFAYSPDMQFGLLSNAKGISLERIDPEVATLAANNWHSAAASAGYSTPGRKNSQAAGLGQEVTGWSVAPSTFSPDHDGMDDQAFIDYLQPLPGFMANITLFDANGRVVRELVRNSLLGTQGRFVWDGLNDRGEQLPAGVYIIYAAIFNQEGSVKYWKQPLVLARRLK
ncbi:Lamin Tail Domain [Chitinophaga costaii]|uniref:Lamin Tail Domain n=1 Tax=Chitinophaga costaii TaxID=1335309 RepID=A0A1C4AZ93_9BACT|nr:Lamin Tail Domain [Chitinophaga costaii]